MNRLEKVLGTICLFGLLTLGAGLVKDNYGMKASGFVVAGLSGVTLSGYYCDKYKNKEKK